MSWMRETPNTIAQRMYGTLPEAGDLIFTPAGLVQHLKRGSGSRRAPIGVKQIRAAIRSGELQASRVGNRNQVRWGSFLRWLDGPCRVHPDASVNEKINDEVAAQLRREGFPRLRG
jgi:hypothetical protein